MVNNSERFVTRKNFMKSVKKISIVLIVIILLLGVLLGCKDEAQGKNEEEVKKEEIEREKRSIVSSSLVVTYKGQVINGSSLTINIDKEPLSEDGYLIFSFSHIKDTGEESDKFSVTYTSSDVVFSKYGSEEKDTSVNLSSLTHLGSYVVNAISSLDEKWNKSFVIYLESNIKDITVDYRLLNGNGSEYITEEMKSGTITDYTPSLTLSSGGIYSLTVKPNTEGTLGEVYFSSSSLSVCYGRNLEGNTLEMVLVGKDGDDCSLTFSLGNSEIKKTVVVHLRDVGFVEIQDKVLDAEKEDLTITLSSRNSNDVSYVVAEKNLKEHKLEFSVNAENIYQTRYYDGSSLSYRPEENKNASWYQNGVLQWKWEQNDFDNQSKEDADYYFALSASSDGTVTFTDAFFTKRKTTFLFHGEEKNLHCYIYVRYVGDTVPYRFKIRVIVDGIAENLLLKVKDGNGSFSIPTGKTLEIAKGDYLVNTVRFECEPNISLKGKELFFYLSDTTNEERFYYGDGEHSFLAPPPLDEKDLKDEEIRGNFAFLMWSEKGVEKERYEINFDSGVTSSKKHFSSRGVYIVGGDNKYIDFYLRCSSNGTDGVVVVLDTNNKKYTTLTIIDKSEKSLVLRSLQGGLLTTAPDISTNDSGSTFSTRAFAPASGNTTGTSFSGDESLLFKGDIFKSEETVTEDEKARDFNKSLPYSLPSLNVSSSIRREQMPLVDANVSPSTEKRGEKIFLYSEDYEYEKEETTTESMGDTENGWNKIDKDLADRLHDKLGLDKNQSVEFGKNKDGTYNTKIITTTTVTKKGTRNIYCYADTFSLSYVDSVGKEHKEEGDAHRNSFITLKVLGDINHRGWTKKMDIKRHSYSGYSDGDNENCVIVKDPTFFSYTSPLDEINASVVLYPKDKSGKYNAEIILDDNTSYEVFIVYYSSGRYEYINIRDTQNIIVPRDNNVSQEVRIRGLGLADSYDIVITIPKVPDNREKPVLQYSSLLPLSYRDDGALLPPKEEVKIVNYERGVDYYYTDGVIPYTKLDVSSSGTFEVERDKDHPRPIRVIASGDGILTLNSPYSEYVVTQYRMPKAKVVFFQPERGNGKETYTEVVGNKDGEYVQVVKKIVDGKETKEEIPIEGNAIVVAREDSYSIYFTEIPIEGNAGKKVPFCITKITEGKEKGGELDTYKKVFSFPSAYNLYRDGKDYLVNITSSCGDTFPFLPSTSERIEIWQKGSFVLEEPLREDWNVAEDDTSFRLDKIGGHETPNATDYTIVYCGKEYNYNISSKRFTGYDDDKKDSFDVGSLLLKKKEGTEGNIIAIRAINKDNPKKYYPSKEPLNIVIKVVGDFHNGVYIVRDDTGERDLQNKKMCPYNTFGNYVESVSSIQTNTGETKTVSIAQEFPNTQESGMSYRTFYIDIGSTLRIDFESNFPLYSVEMHPDDTNAMQYGGETTSEINFVGKARPDDDPSSSSTLHDGEEYGYNGVITFKSLYLSMSDSPMQSTDKEKVKVDCMKEKNHELMYRLILNGKDKVRVKIVLTDWQLTNPNYKKMYDNGEVFTPPSDRP